MPRARPVFPAAIRDAIRDAEIGAGPLLGVPGQRFFAGPVAGVLLLVLCAAVYLPGLRAMPPVDRDESRFAQASRQMFEALALPQEFRDTRPLERLDNGTVVGGMHAGGPIVPMVGQRARINKPPLIYWLQTASAWAFTAGDPLAAALWHYRLPSVVCAALAVLFTWRLGCSMTSAQAAWLAAALLAIAPIVVWDARQARADQALFACTTGALWALWTVFRHRQRPRDELKLGARTVAPVLFWIALALGVLAKGPITPMIAALAALAACIATGQWKWLGRTRPLAGLVILVALLAPVIVLAASTIGLGTLGEIFREEVIERSGSAKEGHWGPPGYHTVLLAVLFWPGSLLTLAAFVRTARLALRLPAPERAGILHRIASLPTRWRKRAAGRDAELFCLAWIIPGWIVMELVSTKLPHYTLPMYPPVAIITGALIVDAARGAVDTKTAERLDLGGVVWLALGLLVCVLPLAGLVFLGVSGPAAVLAVAAGAANLFLLWRAKQALDAGLPIRATVRAAGASIMFIVVALGVVLPRARTVWISHRVLAEVRTIAGDDAPVAAVGFHEDSLVFLTRGALDKIDPPQAGAWLREHPRGVLILPVRDEGEANLDELAFVTVGGEVRGYNYAAGRAERLRLRMNAGAAPGRTP